MALTNWDLFQLANIAINKDVNGRAVKSSEFEVLLNSKSQKMFEERLGDPKEYERNFPVARRGAEVSRVVQEELRAFFRRESVPVVGGAVSLLSLNHDLGYFLDIRTADTLGRSFDELTSSEAAERISSPVVAPTVNDPCYEWSGNNTILVYPSTMATVVATYYKLPDFAVIATTQNPTTLLEEYNAAASTELEWSDSDKVELVYRCLRDLGVNLERADVAAYSENIVRNE